MVTFKARNKSAPPNILIWPNPCDSFSGPACFKNRGTTGSLVCTNTIYTYMIPEGAGRWMGIKAVPDEWPRGIAGEIPGHGRP